METKKKFKSVFTGCFSKYFKLIYLFRSHKNHWLRGIYSLELPPPHKNGFKMLVDKEMKNVKCSPFIWLFETFYSFTVHLNPSNNILKTHSTSRPCREVLTRRLTAGGGEGILIFSVVFASIGIGLNIKKTIDRLTIRSQYTFTLCSASKFIKKKYLFL